MDVQRMEVWHDSVVEARTAKVSTLHTKVDTSARAKVDTLGASLDTEVDTSDTDQNKAWKEIGSGRAY